MTYLILHIFNRNEPVVCQYESNEEADADFNSMQPHGEREWVVEAVPLDSDSFKKVKFHEVDLVSIDYEETFTPQEKAIKGQIELVQRMEEIRKPLETPA